MYLSTENLIKAMLNRSLKLPSSFLLFTFILNAAFGQDFKHYPIPSIDPVEVHNEDLEFLKDEIGQAQVVFLGEQHHGDGGAMFAKSSVAKYLVEEMGFTTIAFEADFYTMNDRAKTSEEKWQSLTVLWENSEQMQYLRGFINNNNINLAGFDLFGLADLSSFTDWYWSYAHSFTSLDKEQIESGLKAIFFNAKSKKEYIKEIYNINPTIEGVITGAYEKQLIKSFSYVITSYQNLKKVGSSYEKYRARDTQMGLNLKWLMNNMLQGEKVIVWAANFHIAKKPNMILSDKKWRFKSGNLITLGQVFDNESDISSYHIAVTSFGGNYTGWMNSMNHYVTIRPENHNENSIESELSKLGVQYAFVPLKNIQKEFSLSGFAHRAFRGDWKANFDAVLFLNKMTPATYLSKD